MLTAHGHVIHSCFNFPREAVASACLDYFLFFTLKNIQKNLARKCYYLFMSEKQQ